MDYIPEQPKFEVADGDIPRSLAPHVQSADTPSNTPFVPFVAFGGTSSCRG